MTSIGPAPRSLPWLMALSALILAFCCATAEARPRIFGTTEIRNENLKPFPKWTGMLDRLFQERGATEGACVQTTFNRCHQEEWQAFVETQNGRTKLEQLVSVNAFMNERRYIVDPINWGVNDYWATPQQFLKKFGDCEDYAIAKYVTLKRLGFSTDDMRIVVLKDLNLGIAHAVLAVFLDDRVMIMDNQIKQVVNANAILLISF